MSNEQESKMVKQQSMKLLIISLTLLLLYGMGFSEDSMFSVTTKHQYIEKEKENEIDFKVIGALPKQETKIRVILSSNNLVIFTANLTLKEKNSVIFSLSDHSKDKVLKCQLEIKDLTSNIFNEKVEVFLYGQESIHPKIPKNTKIIRMENEYKGILAEKLKLETIKLKDLNSEESYHLIFEDIKLESLNEIIENRKNNKLKTKIYVLSNCTGKIKIANKINKLYFSNSLQNSISKNLTTTFSNNLLEMELEKEIGFNFVYFTIEKIEIIYYGFPFDTEINKNPEALLQFDQLLNNNLTEFLK